MTARDVVKTFDAIFNGLEEILPNHAGFTAQERADIALKLTQANILGK